MRASPIKIEEKHARQEDRKERLVDAFLCLDVAASLVAETGLRWKPLVEAGVERRHRLGLPPLENEHWDWSSKADWLSFAAYRSLGIECEGKMQGLMLVIIDGYVARTGPDAGQPLVYVDYVQTAPWNNQDLVDHPRFGGIGSQLLHGAVKLSVELGYGGRVGLHSLQRSERFYRRRGFSPVEVERYDRHARGLWYFELTVQSALDFLNLRGTT